MPGVVVTRCTADSVGAQWAVFLVLTALHVIFNVAAVRSLRLSALNRERVRIILRRFRWHRAAARAAAAARLGDDVVDGRYPCGAVATAEDDPSTTSTTSSREKMRESPKKGRPCKSVAGVVGEGILTPAEVAPMESLLPAMFAWMLWPFACLVFMCQPSMWPVSREGMRWYKRRAAIRVGEGGGIRMGARLSALADHEASRVIARAAAAAGPPLGEDETDASSHAYIVIAERARARRGRLSDAAPTGQWGSGRGDGPPVSVVIRRDARPADMLRAYVHAALISGKGGSILYSSHSLLSVFFQNAARLYSTSLGFARPVVLRVLLQ